MIDFKNKNILVTGANGMIGKELVNILHTTTDANAITAVDILRTKILYFI